MAANFSTVSSVGNQSNANEVPPTSPTCVIDFFEARHRLLTESERIAQESEINQQIKELAIRRDRSLGLANAFEQGLNCLIYAVVLAYLALGIFGH
jgi:hypothetical protein